jgi:hypothetical protein
MDMYRATFIGGELIGTQDLGLPKLEATKLEATKLGATKLEAVEILRMGINKRSYKMNETTKSKINDLIAAFLGAAAYFVVTYMLVALCLFIGSKLGSILYGVGTAIALLCGTCATVMYLLKKGRM